MFTIGVAILDLLNISDLSFLSSFWIRLTSSVTGWVVCGTSGVVFTLVLIGEVLSICSGIICCGVGIRIDALLDTGREWTFINSAVVVRMYWDALLKANPCVSCKNINFAVKLLNVANIYLGAERKRSLTMLKIIMLVIFKISSRSAQKRFYTNS